MVILLILLLVIALFARSLVKPFLVLAGIYLLFSMAGLAGLVIALVALILYWIF